MLPGKSPQFFSVSVAASELGSATTEASIVFEGGDEERAARLAAILVGESPYQHRSPVDAVVISNNEKGD